MTSRPSCTRSDITHSPTKLRAPSSPVAEQSPTPAPETLSHQPRRVDNRDQRKAQPNAYIHQPHQHARVLMAEKLMIKPHHPLVFVLFHKKWPSAAAMAVIVKHRRIGHEKYSPATLAKAHAPIQVLAMQEIGFVPQPNIVDRRSAH